MPLKSLVWYLPELKNPPGVVEVVLADDVGGPGHGTDQHAEVVSGPVLIIVVLSKKFLSYI